MRPELAYLYREAKIQSTSMDRLSIHLTRVQLITATALSLTASFLVEWMQHIIPVISNDLTFDGKALVICSILIVCDTALGVKVALRKEKQLIDSGKKVPARERVSSGEFRRRLGSKMLIYLSIWALCRALVLMEIGGNLVDLTKGGWLFVILTEGWSIKENLEALSVRIPKVFKGLFKRMDKGE